MFIKAKIGAPRPGYAELELPVLTRVLNNQISLFVAEEGYLLTDSLASVLLEQGIAACWVRLGLEDCDPGTLLLSLMNAAKTLFPSIGDLTLKKMRRTPGPVNGWGALFNQLAVEFTLLLPRGTILVLEGAECLNYSTICLQLLGLNFLAGLGKSLRTVIISNQRLPRGVLPAQTVVYDTQDLLLDEKSGLRLLNRVDNSLSKEAINRTLMLSEGKATALASLMNASYLLGPAWVDREIRKAGDLQSLLVKVTRASLEGANTQVIQALSLALQIRYTHPEMTQYSQAVGPWMQPLDNGWAVLRNLWHQPLQKALKVKVFTKSILVDQATNFLVNDRAFYQVVNLYFEQRDPGRAAQIIEILAEDMMDLGQWATLSAWLKRLPTEVLQEWPWLIYIGGKISASQKNIPAARKAFARSSELFLQKEDKRGACLSLLAESACAAWQNEWVFSKERALSAFVLAQRSNLKLYETWSAWRLGGLAAHLGNFGEALSWFSPAAVQADKAGLGSLGKLLHQGETLIQVESQLVQERIQQRQAMEERETSEKEVLAQLQNLLESPPENLDELLNTHGWTNTPLISIPRASIDPMPQPGGLSGISNLYNFITNTLAPQKRGQRLRWAEPINEGEDLGNLPSDYAIQKFQTVEPLAEGSQLYLPGKIANQLQLDAEPPSSSPLLLTPQTQITEMSSEPAKPAVNQPRLKVFLLGSFSVTLDGLSLTDWNHNKGQTIFKYLVVHRSQLASREVLMDTFWPNTAPDAARNSLNVALHNLRRILNSVDEHPIIQFHDGGYRLTPEVEVWVDIDLFEEKVQEGRKLESAGLAAAALQAYEKAIDLYKGDFLEDDPYSEWPVMIRERLRVAFLDILDRSSQIYFSQTDYNSCIALCQLILGYDSCREDAHCRLMRCYSRLGQEYLALRQYQECVDALKAELDVSPAATTTDLYKKIHHREVV